MQTEVSNLCAIRSGITLRKKGDEPTENHPGPYMLRIKDIDGLEISPDYSHPINLAGKLERYIIAAGDVAFSSRGTHCRAGVMPEHDRPYIAPSQLYILTPNDPDGLLPHYLALVLSSEYAENYFRKRRKGSRVQIITKNSLSDLPVTVPPLEAQQRLISLHLLIEQETQLQHGIIAKRKIQFEQSIKLSQAS